MENRPQHPSNKITLENCGDVVRYHAPTAEQIRQHELLAAGAEYFLRAILLNAPDSADRSTALRKVREAKMYASAAVAIDPAVARPASLSDPEDTQP